ncbi:MraY family glycosyltransferase [Thauera butanivorans]|uniref:MraY family glycosyltransferase n=1 Tax=Thauera butanivorans TaxID=86174 RepID=UPI0008381B96|nr:glycosyltransferase family 4 protein [Thauera butanivorans]
MTEILEHAWLLAAIALAAGLMTGGLRRYALARSLLDLPNARSSHAVPTPRGGGVAIVLGFLAATAWLAAHGALPWTWAWALLGAGTAVALVGFLDDHGHVPARWRLLAHFCAAAWVLAWLGGAPPLALSGAAPGWIGNGLAAIYLAWMLNLYNFMDGIDGIAAVEAICAGLGGGALYLLAGQPALALLPLALAAAAAGFLYWNFPPARIFMGDAGSGFVGVALGAMSLQAGWVSPELFWGWLILLGVFVVDATFTLLRRLLRGERVHEAHRRHAYQFAARHFGSHRPVTLAVAALNLGWLLPLALWVGSGGLDGITGVAIAWLPLLALAIRFRAGGTEAE